MGSVDNRGLSLGQVLPISVTVGYSLMTSKYPRVVR